MSARSVFITGAAAGIGRRTALLLAERGWSVGAYDIDEAGLATLVDEVAPLAGSVVTGRLDVTDADAFATAVSDFAGRHGGRLDVLVNNAGILLAGPFEDASASDHHREIDINVKGTVNGLHAAYPHLRATPGATVVNLASASAIYGQADLADYSATKFFVRGITEALDIEWKRHDIRVVSIWPLFVQTAMTADMRTGTTDSLGIRLKPEDVAAKILEAIEPPRQRRALHQVHFPVGFQTSALTLGSRFSPAWLTRAVNKRLAGH